MTNILTHRANLASPEPATESSLAIRARALAAGWRWTAQQTSAALANPVSRP